MEKKQYDLFNAPIQEDWEKEWKDMPEFSHTNKKPIRQIIVSFNSEEDIKAFSELVKQKIGPKSKSMWFPKEDREKPSLFKYIVKDDGNNT